MPGTSSELNLLLTQSEIVRAGAGAGKTTALTKRVLDVARAYRNEHKRLPRIVVTTFTRKATEELRERLLKNATEDGDWELVEYVSSGKSLVISTIHGVLTRFLRQYGHLLGLDGNLQIMNRASANRRQRKIIKDILAGHAEFHSLLDHLTVGQLVEALSESVEATSFHLSPRPANLSDLTSACEKKKKELCVGLGRVTRTAIDECESENWLDALKIFAELSEKENLEEIIEVKKPRFMSKNPPFQKELSDEISEILKEIKEFLGSENTPAALSQFADAALLFAKLRELFIAELNRVVCETGQLEMRDIERFAASSIETSPALARAFGSEWDYWLIDEFQDTSPLQVRLLREFIGQTPAYFVGDPQQSIYLFRGARRDVFEKQERIVQRAGGELSFLDVNYRSNPSLLLFFNDVFSQISPAFMRMKPKSEPVEASRIATFYSIENDSDDPYAPIVQHVQHADSEPFDSFCVLARRNSELLDIARAFEHYGIPTYVHAGGRFFESREVLDLISILKFLLNPHDHLNLIRVLRSPWFYVPDAKIAEVTIKKPTQYWTAFQEQLSGDLVIGELARYREMTSTVGVFETLRTIVLERQIVDYCAVRDATGIKEANIWKFLSVLRESERSPGFQYLQFINELLREDVSAGGDEDADAVAAVEPNHVNLMTIHKSKGLKFRHVILPNLHRRPRFSESRGHESPFVMNESSGLFSIALKVERQGGDSKKLTHSILAKEVLEEFSNYEREEMDRLLYVAMTRAEESVVFHSAAPEAGSFAEKLSQFFEKTGVNERQQYAYEVRKSWPEPQAANRQTENAKSVRPRFLNAIAAPDNSMRWSVTDLVEKHSSSNSHSNENRLLSSQLQKQLELPVWGQKLHSYFEIQKYKSLSGHSGFNGDARAYFEKWFGAEAARFIHAADFTLKLKEPPVRELIEKGFVEWGFQLKSKIGIIEGQIDLWGTIGGITWLVDYKSGSAAYEQKAFYQLDLYTQALRAVGVTEPIRCAVIYALDGKVVIRAARAREEIEGDLLSYPRFKTK